MAEHEVKILRDHYRDVAAGIKTFESRKDDRDFQAGDKLILKEWNGTMYTGRVIECLITHVYRGEFAKEGYCILSIQLLFPETEPRFPMSSFMELHRLYVKSCEECEELRGSV